jgi:hypothetical protein
MAACMKRLSSVLLRVTVWYTFTEVREVFAAFVTSAITVLMEAASSCETSVNFFQTVPRNNPEYNHLPSSDQFKFRNGEIGCRNERFS